VFDPQFSDCSYAFRAARNGHVPTHHHAFTEICNLRDNYANQSLYIAECDIKGFFDTVDHGVALQSFRAAAQRLNLHPRAERLFQAYLNCYSFPVNVLAEAGQRLRRRDQNRIFKWPASELRKLHKTDPHTLRIGVPQGGAVSGIIANVILDAADKCVEETKNRLGAQIHYFRYCDDMILISPVRKHCEAVFDAYKAEVTELKLVFHKPKNTWIYGAKHWDNKSRAVYKWSPLKWFGCVPWVQFVGYQIRYDGLVRTRKESVKKQCLKLVETTNVLKFGLLRAAQTHQIRATKNQTMASLRAKLVAQGVGRFKHFVAGPKPMCWANGFKALHNKPFVDRALRSMDKARKKQIRRFNAAVIVYGTGRNSGNGNRRDPVGYEFSYHAQFTNAGGQFLIQNPWQPRNLKDKLKQILFLFLTGRSVKRWLRKIKSKLA